MKTSNLVLWLDVLDFAPRSGGRGRAPGNPTARFLMGRCGGDLGGDEREPIGVWDEGSSGILFTLTGYEQLGASAAYIVAAESLLPGSSTTRVDGLSFWGRGGSSPEEPEDDACTFSSDDPSLPSLIALFLSVLTFIIRPSAVLKP